MRPTRLRQLRLDEIWPSTRVNADPQTRQLSFEPTSWPESVDVVDSIQNPERIALPSVGSLSLCVCTKRCEFHKCNNALHGFFCTLLSCRHNGICGNALRTHPGLALGKIVVADDCWPQRGDYAVLTVQWIPANVIIGEYVGSLTRSTLHNDYRVELKVRASNNPRCTIYIDASSCGNITRFINHSCKPNSTFREVSRGCYHTVAVVSKSAIPANTEVTVDYGNVWFPCACGEDTCRYK